MDNTPFKNYPNISDYWPNLFPCSPKFDLADAKDLSAWFSEAPKYTTFRVNTLNVAAEEVIQYIDVILKKQSSDHHFELPNVYQHSTLSDCIVINPLGKHMVEPIPSSDEVIVDAVCGAAVLRGADIFAPGVMGISSCVCEGNVVNVYADTAGKCLRGLLVPYLEAGKVFLGHGKARMSRKQLFGGDKHPNGIAIEIKARVSGVPRLCLPSKYGLLQNLPSILCCHVLNPQPGQRVLDMCAAPGNKTTHLATLMQNKGQVIALDKTQRKIDSIISLCERLSVTCVEAFVFDSTKAVADCFNNTLCPPFAPCTFRCVLLDAPCSALGQRPQLVNKISARQIASYPKLQKRLFHNAVHLLESGGTLVYSTCTMTLAENEDIVQWALEQFPEITLVPAEPCFGQHGNPQNGLSEEHCQMVQRFGPPAENSPNKDTIGFFIAKFSKL